MSEAENTNTVPTIAFDFWRKRALAGAIAAVSVISCTSNVSATGLANSGIWGYSPIIFVPLENGATVYGYNISGSMGAAFADGIFVTPTLSGTMVHGLSNTEILGGFLFGSSFSNAGTGGDTAIATGSSLAVGIGAQIIVDDSYTASSSGFGLQNALAAITGISRDASSDGQASTSVDYTATAFIQSSMDLSSGASSVSGGVPVRFFEGYQETSLTEYLLDISNPGASLSPPAPGVPPLAVFAGASGSLPVDTIVSGNDFNLSGGATSAPLVALLLSSQTGNSTVNFDISGDNATFSTTANSSNAFHMLTSANGNASLGFDISGTNTSITTTGIQSHGISWNAFSVGESRTEFLFGGNDFSLATSGDNSLGLFSQINAQDGDALQNFLVTGDDTAFTTLGENASAVVLATNSGGQSENQWMASGNSFTIGTAGSNSTAVTIIANGSGFNSNNLIFSGDDGLVETTGNASAGLLVAAIGGVEAVNSVAFSGNNARVQTHGDGSVGVAILGSGIGLVTGNASFSGVGSGISTVGNNAQSLSMAGTGQVVNLNANLSGPGSSINTHGDHSAGVVIAALGELEGFGRFSITGRQSLVAADGDYATGVFLASTGDEGASSELFMNGRGSRITTLGDYAAGVTFAGHSSELAIGASGGAIETHGLNSHGVFFENYFATATISANGSIITNGAASDGIFSQRLDGWSAITNFGSIDAFGNGINVLGGLRLSNIGDIAAASETGVNFDHGSIVNSGLITGPAGITAIQTGDLPVSVFTPGAILSSDGPSGIALAFLGAGDDALKIGPGTSLSGTIDLGGGVDELVALRGVNADLEVLTPIESVNARTGIVTILNAGNRIIIVDHALFSLSDIMAAKAVNELVSFDSFFSGNETSQVFGWQTAMGAEREGQGTGFCDPHLGFKAGTSDLRRGDSNSLGAADHNGTGGFGFLSSSDCNTNRYALFGGFHSGDNSIGAGNSSVETLFAGIASTHDFESEIILSTLIGLGYTRSEYQRRIINNRLAAGYEWDNSDADSVFAFGKLDLARRATIEPFSISPFLSTEFAVGRRGAFDEVGTNSRLSLSDGQFDYLKTVAGFRTSLFNSQLVAQDIGPDINFAITSEIGLAYTTARSNGELSIGGAKPENFGLEAQESSLLVGLDFQFADNRNRLISSLNASAEMGEKNYFQTRLSGKILVKF